MEKRLMLPIGVEDYKTIRNGEYYYVDKTKMISDILENKSTVSLFTRPRRFGKTLNMSMLKSFFEIGTDPLLFDGLYISKKKDLCDKYMGRYPVIFITLKDVSALTFEEARYSFINQIVREARKFKFLLESSKLDEDEKKLYKALIEQKDGLWTMSAELLPSSLLLLSEFLYKHYGQKVIILIDEYDVPLDKAFQNGYYSDMVALIRGLFGAALKTNEYLEFAVLTGCLRVSKESIFTGINNFNVLSIIDPQFDEEFGFTESEVLSLLKSYNLESHIKEMKEWYDGYRFGDKDIYCPWDVLNYTQRLNWNTSSKPESYWINSSGNGLVKRFIDKADKSTRDEIEFLVGGGLIEKELRLDLTYDEIDSSIDNLWSVLFTTGYLTQSGRNDGNIFKLRIPNEEIREIFRVQIREWFNRTVKEDKSSINALWASFSNGDAEGVEKALNKILSLSISVFDTAGTEKEKEKYYHALLAGLLIGKGTWGVKSNDESGDGRPDIIVRLEDPDRALIIETKRADKITDLDRLSDEALGQIKRKRYDVALSDDGRSDILIYGIAFYKKRCRVKVEKL